MKWRLTSLLVLGALLAPSTVAAQGVVLPAGDSVPSTVDLCVGHWVQVKGVYEGQGRFTAQKIEILQPSKNPVLVGVAEDVLPNKGRFWVNGQLVRTSDKTEWNGTSISEIDGRLIKLKGRYHGPKKFSARSVGLRAKGRASLEGRIDRMRSTEEGYEAVILSVRVLIPFDVPLVTDLELSAVELAPVPHAVMEWDQPFGKTVDEDDVPGTIQLTDTLRFGAMLEARTTIDENFNLRDDRRRSREQYQPSMIAELRWQPTKDFTAMVRGRAVYRYRTEQEKFDTKTEDAALAEAWLRWQDILDSGLEIKVGRQDFDEPREWLYDQNLDAIRMEWSRPGFRLDLSASTTFSDGSNFDEHANNFIVYLSNNDWDRHVAAYIIDRRDSRQPQNYPIHFGVRALGKWIPGNDSWFEYSVLRGFAKNQNLESWAFDIGTTWSPETSDPFYFTVGYAFATGDDPSTANVNESFQQTGLHDNNGRFGGVTSFRYYGELLEPELSNLGILTLGVGFRPTKNSSVDLIYHDYRLSELTTRMGRTDLRTQPNGIGYGVGQELDLVMGFRRWAGVDLKFVLGYFDPGSAFTPGDPAFVSLFRLRYRF